MLFDSVKNHWFTFVKSLISADEAASEQRAGGGCVLSCFGTLDTWVTATPRGWVPVRRHCAAPWAPGCHLRCQREEKLQEWKGKDSLSFVQVLRKIHCPYLDLAFFITKPEKSLHLSFFFFKYFIYLFLERKEGREKERERNINVWLPLVCPQLGTWPATQTCSLTGNWTGNPLVCRPALSPLSHTSHGKFSLFISFFKFQEIKNQEGNRKIPF